MQPLPVRTYAFTYITLMVLFVITFSLSFIDMGRYWNNGIAEGIACTKAVLVALFFMHVKYSSKLTWVFASAGVIWLGLLLTLTGAEYFGRNHPPGINPKGEPVYLMPRE